MEVQSSFEFAYPSYECFQALQGAVLPRFRVTYRVGYPLFKIPAGRIRIKVVESHERAGFLKAKMQLAPYAGIPYTFGPEILVTCVVSGAKRCTVEISAEAKMWDGEFLNYMADLSKRLAPRLVKKAYPRLYFDQTAVYDEQTLSSDSHRQDANVRALKYLFARMGEQLAAGLGR